MSGMKKLVAAAAVVIASLGSTVPASAHDAGTWTYYTDHAHDHPCTFVNGFIQHDGARATFGGTSGSAVNHASDCDTPTAEYGSHIIVRIEVFRWDGDHWTEIINDGWRYNWDMTYQAWDVWDVDTPAPAWYLTRAWGYVMRGNTWQGGPVDSPVHWLP